MRLKYKIKIKLTQQDNVEGVRRYDQQHQQIKHCLRQVDGKANDRGEKLDVCFGLGAVGPPPPLVQPPLAKLDDHPHCPPPSVLAPVEGLLGGPGLLVISDLEALAIDAWTVGCVGANAHELVGSGQVTGQDGGVLELGEVELLQHQADIVRGLLAPVAGTNDQAAAPPIAAVATHIWTQLLHVKDGELHEVLVVATVLCNGNSRLDDRLPDDVLADDVVKVLDKDYHSVNIQPLGILDSQ